MYFTPTSSKNDDFFEYTYIKGFNFVSINGIENENLWGPCPVRILMKHAPYLAIADNNTISTLLSSYTVEN